MRNKILQKEYLKLSKRNRIIRKTLRMLRKSPSTQLRACQIKLLREYYDADCDIMLDIKHPRERQVLSSQASLNK